MNVNKKLFKKLFKPKPKPSKSAERLRRILNAAYGFNIPEAFTMNRQRCGPNDRSAGAWAWYIEYRTGEHSTLELIGSQWPLAELLKAKSWDIGIDNSVIPLNEPGVNHHRPKPKPLTQEEL